ncbi:dehydrogenase [Mycobacterium marinum]|nr:dehydrogenase [Mycobacterium marinum]
MDLRIAGRTALVTASSQGLGRACASALIAEGVSVVINGRETDKLERAATEIGALATHGASCRFVTADLTTDTGVQAIFDQVDQLDILVTNNRGPRPADIIGVTDDDLAESLRLHYYVPIHLVQRYLPGMRDRRFGRIVNITSEMVESPVAGMIASAGARSALTTAMKGVQHDSVADNVTINQLLPMLIDSPRQLQMAQLVSESSGVAFEEIRRRQASVTSAKRLGRPEEVGAACAFLCSEQAGYISGVSLPVNGGGPVMGGGA